MKSLIFNLFMFAFALTASPVSAQSTAEMNRLLGSSLQKIRPNDIQSVTQGISELKRIATIYPEQWLPIYYQALFAIQYAIQRPDDKASVALLIDAKQNIEKAEHLAGADLSEVYTLSGFYDTALIVQNPSVNGMRYYSDAIGNYQRAIHQNVANPRPRLLLYLFNEQMNKFTGGTNFNAEKDLQKIKSLFDKEQKTDFEPSWGKDLIPK